MKDREILRCSENSTLHQRLLQGGLTQAYPVGMVGNKTLQKILLPGLASPQSVAEFDSLLHQERPGSAGDEHAHHLPSREVQLGEAPSDSNMLTLWNRFQRYQRNSVDERSPPEDEATDLSGIKQHRGKNKSSCQKAESSADAEEKSAMQQVSPWMNFPVLMENVAVEQPVRHAQDIDQWISLVEKQVDQLWINDKAEPGKVGSQVLVTLKNPVFEEASLLLTRTHTGWTLKPVGISEESVGRWKRNSHRLVERFAERGLGVLDIELVEDGTEGW